MPFLSQRGSFQFTRKVKRTMKKAAVSLVRGGTDQSGVHGTDTSISTEIARLESAKGGGEESCSLVEGGVQFPEREVGCQQLRKRGGRVAAKPL